MVDQHPQRLELTVRGEDAQTPGTNRSDRNRVRVVGIGLATMACVEQPCPGCELGGNINHSFADLHQSLGEWGPTPRLPIPALTTGARICAGPRSRPCRW